MTAPGQGNGKTRDSFQTSGAGRLADNGKSMEEKKCGR